MCTSALTGSTSMKINPYLIFNGDCKAAFTFYAESLPGQLEAMLTFGETLPREHVPKDLHNLIIHTRLAVGDQAIMGSDTTPDRPTDEMSGCSISLNVDSIQEAEQVFSALSEGGRVQMPLEDLLGSAFWHVGRSLWRVVDGQLRKGPVTIVHAALFQVMQKAPACNRLGTLATPGPSATVNRLPV